MIEIKNMEKKYGEHSVFENANFKIDDEYSINCMIGSSGSGKTTLFQILFGLDMEYSGTYIINNKNARDLSIKEWADLRTNFIQIVYQDFKLLENFTVYENMLFAANDQIKDIHIKINELLKDMNIEHIQDSRVAKISGGEKQRLALARALMLHPKIILLDEPTGNLDDKNTNVIMEQIRKMAKRGVIIIIISHDNRVIPYCDNTFLIENKKIIQQSHSPVIHGEGINTSYTTDEIKNKKVKSFRYVMKRMKANKIDLIIANLPVVVIFMVFIAIFGLIYNKSIEANNSFYGGVKDDVIVLSTSNYTSAYKKALDEKNLGPFDDGVRICFSQKDLANVLKIDNVKDARLFNSTAISSFDVERYFLDLKFDKQELSAKVKEQSNYSRIPENLSFSFTSLTVPSAYIDSYNPKEIDMLYGGFPSSDNEIILPDILAYQYMKEVGETSLPSLIKEKVSLQVHNDTYTDMVKDYIISGIYKTNFDSSSASEVSVYVNYNQFDFLDLFSTKESYEEMKREYISVNGSIAGTVYETYDAYIKALGTNLGDMIIRIDKPENADEVTSEISKLFPNLKQLSQYGFKQGDFKSAYNKMISETFGIVAIIAACFGFIILFMNKNYIKNRSKEMAILYSLGYTKRNVISIIIYEYLISTVGNYLIAYVLIFLAFKMYLESTSLYSIVVIILNLPVFFLGFAFIMLMTVVSVLFSINGVKQRNLKRYLR